MSLSDQTVQPLSGIRVVELSSSLAGPYIGMCLGDMGADIIKVENPSGGDLTRQWTPPEIGGEATYFLSTNRNKRSVALDLRAEEGQSLLRRMVRDSDIVIDNFRPDSALHQELCYDRLRAENDRLIMVHISAFGEVGPWKGRPGFDLVAQASAGLMSVTGQPDGPPVRAGYSVADLSAGIFGLVGVLAALFERSLTGKGRYVTTSLFEAQLALHVNLAMNLFAGGGTAGPLGSAHPNLAPYQAFRAKDGYFVIAAGSDRLFQRTCEAIGRADLADADRFRTNARRVSHREELVRLLEAVLASRSVDEWCTLLDEHGVPNAPVLDLTQVYGLPHTQALNIVRSVNHVAGPLPQVASPISLDGHRLAPRLPPPTLGQHTKEVLADIGVDPASVAALFAAGTIA
ncbi:formyl-CoA transferase [Mycobacterium sp. ACS1612]|uniref:CaiB/BaiF CoA transferase family protein n=1 Tax=Mycobacterium sp. ACS1612 TaxID=1834117 RepID=UPI0008011C05|nr:CoA transferase [Mycobacterium sp. ACS1612]OBF29341.1 formyl-CoA transferase [Mycobacterium sp. ACS1612]